MDTLLKLDNVTKKKILFLFLFSLVESICFLSGSIQLGGIISLVLLYVTVIWDRHFPLTVYIITQTLGTSLIGTVSTINAIFLSLLALYDIFQKYSNPKFRKYFFITIYFFVVLFFSYVTGINSHLDFAIKIIVASLVILQIATFDTQERALIITAVLCSGIAMSMIMIISLSTGTIIQDISTRLQYNEKSKHLSTTLAPLILSSVYMLLYYRGTKKILFNCGLIFVVAILSYMLVLTYSRGVLAALIISVSYLLFRYMGRLNFRKFFVLVLLTISAFIFVSNMQIDSDLMFENVEGGNGRTDIWIAFIQQLKETNSLAFGFGPGFTKDISQSDFYSHSTILDYLFCYGITGFVYILYLILSVSFKLFKNNIRLFYYQGLFLLNVIMFSTHGSAGTLLFNVILGLCMSVVVNENKERDFIYNN